MDVFNDYYGHVERLVADTPPLGVFTAVYAIYLIAIACAWPLQYVVRRRDVPSWKLSFGERGVHLDGAELFRYSDVTGVDHMDDKRGSTTVRCYAKISWWTSPVKFVLLLLFFNWAELGRRQPVEYILIPRGDDSKAIREHLQMEKRILAKSLPEITNWKPLYHFIVNPKAGKPGRPLEMMKRVERVFQFNHMRWKVTYTKRRGHAKYMARAWTPVDGNIVVLVGGDGLMHEFVNGLMRTRQRRPCMLFEGFDIFQPGMNDPVIAVLPAGSGNGVATSLGFDMCDFEGATSLIKNVQQDFDALKCTFEGGATDVNGKEFSRPLYCIATLQRGIIAEVDNRSERFRFLGSFRFTLEALLSIFTYQPRGARGRLYRATENLVHSKSPLSAICENKCTDVDIENSLYTNIMVANCPYVTWDMKFAPWADPTSGSCDYVALTKVNALGLLIDIFLNVADGSHVRTKTARASGCVHRVNGQVAIEVDMSDSEGRQGALFDVDGEFFWTKRGKVNVNVVPGALKVVVAKRFTVM